MDFNNDELKKLQEQQLIENILKRKDIEHDALVEATKASMKDSNINIQYEKKRIVENKYKEREKKDKEEIKAVENKILDAEIDELLKIYNEQERLAAQKRKVQVDEILSCMEQELQARRRLTRLAKVDKMVKKQAERFRVNHANKQNKVENFVYKLKIFEAREKIQRDKEKKLKDIKARALEEQEEKNEEELKKGNGNDKKLYLNPEEDFIYSENKKRTYIEVTNRPKTKKKIHQLNYKMLNAIKKYTNVVEFYERNKYIFQRNRKNKQGQKNDRTSFIDSLKFGINHKKAIKNVEARDGEKTFKSRSI